ncbi:hypothetical protein FIBSPDRAFT_929611 [Athelia psychrophila]|uniref:Uncharacterized protein n=1 Tax=Athelia psychrophila TaxID=1759441 RepID=A0A166NJG2_9AGAM|nr:hypothetical protein FIBSPDRAFT_929611 [Fibularhizoctonia sp. CBS 109695]
MAKNLLPIRILFHSAFALVYLPAIALAYLDDVGLGLISLSALVCLGGFTALKVNQTAFLCIDIFFAVSLPMCLFVFISDTIFAVEDFSSDPDTGTFLPINLVATAIIVGLTVFYVLYIIIAAVTDKISGNAFLPVDPDYPPPPSSGTQRKVFLIGRRRTLTERAAVSNHCTSYIFQSSVFRKHPFEPTGWAIFRGIIAVYCFAGLLVFAAYTGYSGGETYANAGVTIQETILPKAQEALSNLLASGPYLSVAILYPISQSIPSDISVSGYAIGSRVVPVTSTFGPSDTANSQYWIADEYRWIDSTSFNVSWSGDVTLYTWATVANGDGPTNSSQAIYSPGFLLEPFQEYDIALTIISYKMNDFSWIFLEPYVRSAVASGSNKTVANFSYSSWMQIQIRQRDLITPSAPALFAQALSAIGGIYASVDVLFALIFGRTVLAILFGSKIISPFGVLGIVTRDRLRHLINEQYPRLQEDIERGGMAAYVSEVAIDPGLVPNSTSAHIRARAASTQAQASHAGDDAEGAGLIPLRSMEPSNTSGKSSHSQLQLPYAIEDYEPARKHDYE